MLKNTPPPHGGVGYIRGHLHEDVDRHKRKASSIYKHYQNEHNGLVLMNLVSQFHVLPSVKTRLTALLKRCFLYVG